MLDKDVAAYFATALNYNCKWFIMNILVRLNITHKQVGQNLQTVARKMY
jgi:hypothetical protein